MGDVIDFTTFPTTENVFYEVSSNGITFAVRTSWIAVLGLARKPSPDLDVKIELHNYSTIKVRNGNVTKVPTMNIIQNDVFHHFWLYWDDENIKLGRQGQLKPLIHHTSGIKGIKFITFGSPDARHPIHWKIDLPPVFKTPEVKSFEEGQVRWVPCDTQLPDGVIIGGFEKNEPLYIIRAPHRGSLTPGKFVPSLGLGFISWGGQANEKSEFEALCGYNCTWVKTSESQIPQGAIEGGHSESNDEVLYIGRAYYDGHVIPGKVQPSHKVCYVAYQGRERAASNYEILVTPTANNRIVRRYRLNSNEYEHPDSDPDSEDNHIDNYVF